MKLWGPKFGHESSRIRRGILCGTPPNDGAVRDVIYVDVYSSCRHGAHNESGRDVSRRDEFSEVCPKGIGSSKVVKFKWVYFIVLGFIYALHAHSKLLISE